MNNEAFVVEFNRSRDSGNNLVIEHCARLQCWRHDISISNDRELRILVRWRLALKKGVAPATELLQYREGSARRSNDFSHNSPAMDSRIRSNRALEIQRHIHPRYFMQKILI